MRIAVCMKQVPAYSEGNMDEKTGLIIRSGLEAIVNVYDLAALEAALQIREAIGGTVTVYSMGPERARQVLVEAFAMGADEGYLISDRHLGGADVLATSYTLYQGLKCHDSYDLILCGKQTTDGDTAQVSGALARWLSIPHYLGVSAISVTDQQLEIEQLFEIEQLRWRIQGPCLLAVEKEFFVPRMPTLKLRMAGKKKPIGQLSVTDFADSCVEHYGLKGSATKVKRIFPPPRTDQQQLVLLPPVEAAGYMKTVLDQVIKTGKEPQ